MTRYDLKYLQLHYITLLIIKINSVIITMLSYLHDLPSVFVFQKENEKAVDELRKFYSAQAVKHKENMEQAVNHKVSGLQPTYYYVIILLLLGTI